MFLDRGKTTEFSIFTFKRSYSITNAYKRYVVFMGTDFDEIFLYLHNYHLLYKDSIDFFILTNYFSILTTMEGDYVLIMIFAIITFPSYPSSSCLLLPNRLADYKLRLYFSRC